MELLIGPSLGVLLVVNWSKFVLTSWPLLVLDPKLGPVNNPYLHQLITIKNGLFFLGFFLLLKCAEIPIL